MDSCDIFGTESQEEQEVEEELTAAEVLHKLEEAWLNEKHAPELLQPKMEIVECMLEQVATMEGNLSRLKKGDMRLSVHRMELQRIRFLVNSYLRLRLEKVQEYIFHYTAPGSEENNRVLTPSEATFAAGYRTQIGEHFHSLALRHLEGQAGPWEPERSSPALPKPRLTRAVFVAVNEDRQGLEVRDEAGGGKDETVDLLEGAQHILQYHNVQHLLTEGSVRLI